MTVVSATYYASEEDLDKIYYLSILQDMKDDHTKKQYHDVGLLESIQSTQYESK